MVFNPVWNGGQDTTSQSEEDFSDESGGWVNEPVPEDGVYFHAENFREHVLTWGGDVKSGAWHPEWLSQVNVDLHNDSQWVVLLVSEICHEVKSLQVEGDLIEGWEFELSEEPLDSGENVGIQKVDVPPDEPSDIKAVDSV